MVCKVRNELKKWLYGSMRKKRAETRLCPSWVNFKHGVLLFAVFALCKCASRDFLRRCACATIAESFASDGSNAFGCCAARFRTRHRRSPPFSSPLSSRYEVLLVASGFGASKGGAVKLSRMVFIQWVSICMIIMTFLAISINICPFIHNPE